MNENVIVLDHPILNHKLAMLRNKNTHALGFRGMVDEISTFLAYEASKDLPTQNFEVESPLAMAKCERPSEYPILVPIMRAGNGMINGIAKALPHSSIGHIGVYRDKFIDNTVEYYFKLPENHKGNSVYLLDPMVATGDTAIASIDRLKQYGVGQIKILCILISEEAVKRVAHFHPDVKVLTIGIEKEMTPEGKLTPGMGDVGNRLFNGMDLEL